MVVAAADPYRAPFLAAIHFFSTTTHRLGSWKQTKGRKIADVFFLFDDVGIVVETGKSGKVKEGKLTLSLSVFLWRKRENDILCTRYR